VLNDVNQANRTADTSQSTGAEDGRNLDPFPLLYLQIARQWQWSYKKDMTESARMRARWLKHWPGSSGIQNFEMGRHIAALRNRTGT
jgi:hypothetical protein